MKRAIYPNLSKEVKKYGEFEGKLCYNCGSCTISCPLSNGEVVFPRRPIQLVHIGAKEELLAELGPWVCHFCGDCSTTCPQKAEPGTSMHTIRKYLTASYDWTGISSLFYKYTFFRIAFYLFALFLVFFLIFLYHIKIADYGLTSKDFFNTSMGIDHVFGDTKLIYYFVFALFLLPLFILITNTLRMWYFTMVKGSRVFVKFSHYTGEIKEFITNLFYQKKFKECKEKGLWTRHFTTFLGFALIAFITFFLLSWKIEQAYTIKKFFGYIATILLFYGSISILLGRFKKREEIHKSKDFSDWSLPLLIFLITLSGILTHVFRYTKMELTSHMFFLVHVVLLGPLMLVELPFGKLAHLLYQPIGLYFKGVKERAEKENREKEVKVA